MSSILTRFSTGPLSSIPCAVASRHAGSKLALSMQSTFPRSCMRSLSVVIPPPASNQRSEGTLRHQNDLPKFPIPPLEDTMQRYLERTLPLLDCEDAKEKTRQVVQHFLENDGKKAHAALLDYDSKHDNYMETFYREMYSGADYSNYSLNPNFVVFPDAPAVGSTAPETAAKLTGACLQYLLAAKDGSFPATVTKAGPQDMSQIPWVLSSARVASLDPVDDIVSYIDESRHIVVFCKGAAYKLTVLDEDFNIIADEATLQQRFSEIMSHADGLEDTQRSAIGALSTGSRAIWSAARDRVSKLNPDKVHHSIEAAFAEPEWPSNEEILHTIDSAIAVFTLEDVTGLSGEGMEQLVLYGLPGTIENRWMDKWNIMVCRDGQAGMSWEHSILDGHTMMEFMAPVAAGFHAGYEIKPSPENVVVQHMPIEVDSQTEQEISDAIKASLSLSENVGVETLEFQEFGANAVKSLKCSPDGFVQGAMFVTFHDLYNRPPVPYESVLAKKYKHGRVTVARSSSDLITETLRQYRSLTTKDEQQKAFLTLVGDISRLCHEAAAAKEIDRPLFAYRCLGAGDAPLFKDHAWKHFSTFDLCTSHCGRDPIRFFGYEPPNSRGFSIGYYVGPERMQFSINHFDKGEAAKYKAHLETVIREMHQVMSN